jgi:hypothetical protein
MFLSFMGAWGRFADGSRCRINATIGIEPADAFHQDLEIRLSSVQESATVQDILTQLQAGLSLALNAGARFSLLSPANDQDEEEEWDEDIIETYGEGYIYGFSNSQACVSVEQTNEIISDREIMAALISDVIAIDAVASCVEIWGEDVFKLVRVGNPETENTWWELLDEDDSELASGEEIGFELAQLILEYLRQ